MHPTLPPTHKVLCLCSNVSEKFPVSQVDDPALTGQIRALPRCPSCRSSGLVFDESLSNLPAKTAMNKIATIGMQAFSAVPDRKHAFAKQGNVTTHVCRRLCWN